QRIAGAGADHAVRLALRDQGDRIGAVQALDSASYGLKQASGVDAMHQVRDHLGIGLRLEGVALAFQFVAEFFVVFDDPVMHNRNFTAREYGVGVAGYRCTMRRPARMRDSGLRREPLLRYLRGEIRDPRDAAKTLQTIFREHCDAAGVISAVFETPQAFNQDRNDVASGRRADDATHGLLRSSQFLAWWCPARQRYLPRARQRQLPGWRVLADGRTGTDVRAPGDPHRRDQRRVRAYKAVVLDHRTVLVDAVIVAGNGPRADIDTRADLGITDVSEMVCL